MSIEKIAIGLIVGSVAGSIISLVSGFAYDLAWNVGDYAMVEINQCDSLNGGWKEQCENIKSKYENGKNLIHFFSFIVPFFAVLLFFIRQD